MDKVDKTLFQLLRSMNLLLEHFKLTDNASMVQGEFVCIDRMGYPYAYFRGSYLDCLYEVFKKPGFKIIPASELEIAEQLYRLRGTEYDDEHRQMIQENRLIDKELRRRKKVRRKRPPGRPRKEKPSPGA